MEKTINVPRLSLVLLVGPAGSGKSTFAAKHFAPSEILSSDRMRWMIDDDETSQGATNDAFEVLRLVAEKRLARGRLTVIDATNVHAEDRRPFLKLAQTYHTAAVAIVLNVETATCVERNAVRRDRSGPPARVVERHVDALVKGLPNMRREGLYRVVALSDPAQIDAVVIRRERMRADRTDERGPFDIIGDVHGCCDELEGLLGLLGYGAGDDGVWRHPEGRRAVFLGDLIDRGPRSVDVLRLVMSMCEAGSALCVCGNHENLLVSWFRGKPISPGHGLRETIDGFDQIPEAEYGPFKARCAKFLGGLDTHLILDGGRLIVAHGGMTSELAGRMGVRRFALYGETKGEIDGFVRKWSPLWAQRYRAKARIIYGHAAVREPKRVHNTLNIDTGCVFGGKLTALRYPEGDVVSVAAATEYFIPAGTPGKPERAASEEGSSASAGASPEQTGEGPAPAGEAPAPVEPSPVCEGQASGPEAEGAPEASTPESASESASESAPESASPSPGVSEEAAAAGPADEVGEEKPPPVEGMDP